MTSKLKEGVMQGVFTLCACVSILAVALICIFLFANGVPTLFKIGPLKFLLGTTWKPGNDIFGILPMILGSIYVTAGAILVGVPIGLLTAIYMSKFASPRINKVMLPAVQLLAGIPSVVYGFFGMIVLVPAVQAMVKSPFFKTVLHVKSGKGMSLFTAAVLLGIMILPTIITVSKASLDAVPDSYYEGSLALGATHERSVFYAVLPAAKSGVLSAVILGIGRAIGETMAVVMVAGNQTWMPKGLFQGLRTMTSNIVIEMGYAADLHREALIATALRSMCSSGAVMRSSTLRSSSPWAPSTRSAACLPVSVAAWRTTRRRRGSSESSGSMRVRMRPSWRSELTRDCWVNRVSYCRVRSSIEPCRLCRSAADSASARASCCRVLKRSSSSGSKLSSPASFWRW